MADWIKPERWFASHRCQGPDLCVKTTAWRQAFSKTLSLESLSDTEFIHARQRVKKVANFVENNFKMAVK